MRNKMITKRLLEPALLVILTLAYYKMPWAGLPGPAGLWGTLFLIGYVLVLPGNMLSGTLNPLERNPAVRAVSTVLYGLFFFVFVSFLWALTRANLAWLKLNLPGWIFLLYLVTHMRRSDASGAGLPLKSARTGAAALLVICVSLFILVWITGLPIDYTNETMGHIAYVNEVQATGEAFPVSTFHAEAGDNGRDMRKGLLHVFYGFTGDYQSIDGFLCLRIWNAVFIMILIGSIYGAASMLFGNPWIALLSSVFFIIGGIGGSDGTTLREAVLPDRFGYAYFLFLIAFMMRYVKGRDWRDLLTCGCFAFAASAAHIFYAVLSCLAAAIVIIWKVCYPAASFREHLRGALPVMAAVAAGALPYVLFRCLNAFGAPNEIYGQVEGMVYIGEDLFVANPLTLFSWFGLLGTVTFLVIPAIWRQRIDNAGLGYMIAAGFTVPLILLNPILLPPFQGALRYMVYHLSQLFPFYILAAYLVVHSFGEAGGGGKRIPPARLLCIVLIVAAVVDLLPVFHKSPVSPGVLRAQKQKSYLRWEDGLAYLRDRVPEGTVIVSDPLTSSAIAAFTPHYVTCVYGRYGPPGDRLASERIRMTREVLTPFSPLSTSIGFMEEMDADYIVLNNRFGSTVPLFYWAMQQDAYFPIRDKFISHKELFRPRFHRDGFLVLEWTGRKPEDIAIGANPYYLQEIPLGFSHVGLQAGEAKLEAYYVEKSHAARETVLEMSFVWSGNQDYRMRNYVVEVRFDIDDPVRSSEGSLLPRVARRIKEAVKRGRYRFRANHMILDGFLSPDVWPDNTFVLDPATISIPPDVVPGRYTISVELLVATERPNYHIRDIFFDDACYRGVPIDAVTIE
jgi:hypothetical protein